MNFDVSKIMTHRSSNQFAWHATFFGLFYWLPHNQFIHSLFEWEKCERICELYFDKLSVYFLIELGREKKKKIHSQRRALTSEKVHLRDEQKPNRLQAISN